MSYEIYKPFDENVIRMGLRFGVNRFLINLDEYSLPLQAETFYDEEYLQSINPNAPHAAIINPGLTSIVSEYAISHNYIKEPKEIDVLENNLKEAVAKSLFWISVDPYTLTINSKSEKVTIDGVEIITHMIFTDLQEFNSVFSTNSRAAAMSMKDIENEIPNENLIINFGTANLMVGEELRKYCLDYDMPNL